MARQALADLLADYISESDEADRLGELVDVGDHGVGSGSVKVRGVDFPPSISPRPPVNSVGCGWLEMWRGLPRVVWCYDCSAEAEFGG